PPAASRIFSSRSLTTSDSRSSLYSTLILAFNRLRAAAADGVSLVAWAHRATAQTAITLNATRRRRTVVPSQIEPAKLGYGIAPRLFRRHPTRIRVKRK